MENTTYSTTYMAIVVIAKITGLISVFGSSFILRDLFRNRRKKLKGPKNQIIFCLSISDIISSFFLHIIGSWFVPKGLIYGSFGNIATCTVQGYIGFMFVTMGAGFNASLSISYILVVRYQWKPDRMKQVVSYLIFIPIATSVVLCTTAIFYDSFNYGGGWACDVNGSPLGCDFAGSTLKCERGIHAMKFAVAIFTIVSVWFTIVVGSMFLLFWTVFKQEKAVDKFNFRGSINTRKHSKPVAMQGILFVVAFILSHLLYWIAALLAFYGGSFPLVLTLMMALTAPLQGFFNALVYFRPIYLEHRKRRFQKPFKKKIHGGNTNTEFQPQAYYDSSVNEENKVDIETQLPSLP